MIYIGHFIKLVGKNNCTYCPEYRFALFIMAKKAINRIKVALVERGRTNKWLASKLNKSAGTVSRWCTNDMQPSLETLVQVAEILKVDVRELLVKTDPGSS